MDDHDPDTMYAHWTKRMVYTSGVRWMAETAKAYWLIDACASWLPDKKLRGEEFIVFRLKVHPDNSATLTGDDGNGNILITQQIEYTDYAKAGETECELYAVGTPGQPTVLMLPSEY